MNNPSGYGRRWMIAWALLASLALPWMGGCSTTSKATDAQGSDLAASDQQLKLDGDSALLGEAVGGGLTRATFIARLQEFTARGKVYDALQWCVTYHDLSEQVVLYAADAPDPVVDMVSMYLDQSNPEGQGGWQAMVQMWRTHRSAFAQYEHERQAAWQAARRGEFEAFASLTPPAGLESPWLSVESLSLRGKSALVSGQPDVAGAAFREAAEKAEGWDPRVASRMWLFAALAAQMQGELQQAEQLCDRALNGVVAQQVNHPTTLRLAIRIAKSAGGQSEQLPSMRALRYRLGELLFDRGQPQAALLAWREAETEPGNGPSTNRLRLQQANALIAMRKYGTAMSLLVGLAQTDLRAEALASLGLLHMQRGQMHQGLAMLREATTSTQPTTHPQVHADTGLALLAAGEKEIGLEKLHAAREAFSQRQDWSGVRTTHKNEMRYAAHAGERDSNQSLSMELARVENLLVAQLLAAE